MFKNSKKTYKGIPVIAANMDTVGTFEMAVTFAKVLIKFPFFVGMVFDLSVVNSNYIDSMFVFHKQSSCVNRKLCNPFFPLKA